jgi:hypothetical protein
MNGLLNDIPKEKIIKTTSQVLCLIHACSHELKIKQSKIEIVKINEVGFNPISHNKLRKVFIEVPFLI